MSLKDRIYNLDTIRQFTYKACICKDSSIHNSIKTGIEKG